MHLWNLVKVRYEPYGLDPVACSLLIKIFAQIISLLFFKHSYFLMDGNSDNSLANAGTVPYNRPQSLPCPLHFSIQSSFHLICSWKSL